MKVSTDLALLSNIIRSTDDAIISKNLDSIVTSWNPAAERLFGYAAHEIIGQSITLIIPNEFIHEEKEIIQKILKGESIDHYETQRKRKDGKRIDLSISVSPIRNDHGKIIGASKIARDITERKANAKRLLESERFNRALLDSLDLHIAVVNPAGHILNTNQAWNNFAHSNGVTSLSRVGVGGNYFESCANAVAAGDGIAEQALQGIQSVLTRETEIFELEYPCDSPTERRWFLLRALAFQEGNVITMHQNITQRKLAELQIKKNEERFSSIVAHGNDIIALLDRNLKVIYRSPSVERIFGLDIATGELNQPQATRMELVHPDDKDRYLETLKRSIDNPGQSFNVSFKSEHGSGRFVEIEGVATNYLNDESIGAIVLNLRDVSERNSLERQLIRNELQMRLLIKHTPAAVAMFDSEMKYIIASERWMVDYQLGDQNIIGKSHYEIFPEISAEWKALHQRTLQGEGLFKEEDPFVRADGTTDWVRWEMQPWYTENHSIGGMILFTEVITERKVAEEKIHQLHDEIAKSERKFRALVEHSDSVINVLDENFNPIYRSPNGHKLTGYTNSDRIEGGTFSWIHPEDLKSVEEFFIGRLSAPGVPASIITRLKHKDGQYRWMEITATNLLHDDSVKGIVINARNINELKNAVEEVKLLNDELSKNELRFRSLVENNEALIILVDENFKALYRSPSSERVSGFSDEELAIENGMLKIHPDDLSNFVASFNESKANPGKTIYVGDFRFKHKKGHYFWLAASFKNFLNDRSVGAIVLNAIDITVKKEAE
ncbi:MAG TPA: hypothetical protein DGG95_12725, partial [Cytophagales bacterium]|nr:hypothetical protein [Cytophagales bacterium]